ncbi:unnamed protein product [Vicia faba]|uniref:Secreted protein n=1 Tax=Vicia faba TaxID=3906 RepID=A0AAV0Z6P6_VICFA|nr:unnamed protein product [Vicia faba]
MKQSLFFLLLAKRCSDFLLLQTDGAKFNLTGDSPSDPPPFPSYLRLALSISYLWFQTSSDRLKSIFITTSSYPLHRFNVVHDSSKRRMIIRYTLGPLLGTRCATIWSRE